MALILSYVDMAPRYYSPEDLPAPNEKLRDLLEALEYEAALEAAEENGELIDNKSQKGTELDFLSSQVLLAVPSPPRGRSAPPRPRTSRPSTRWTSEDVRGVMRSSSVSTKPIASRKQGHETSFIRFSVL